MLMDAEMAEIAKVFFQESREGLDVMESGLLSLGTNGGAESINTIFRAAHSIKGGAATFGFSEVAQFTHGVETLLDEMRNGARPVTSQSIQTLLQACDCLREMITATESGQPLDQGRIASLNADLGHILGEASQAAPVAAPAQAPAAAGWRIRFDPVPDLLRVRNEPTRMFAELKRLGRLTAVADVSRIPLLEEIDPETCYLSWNIEMEGRIPREKLVEIFDWVDPNCGLEFIAMDCPGSGQTRPGESKADAPPAAESAHKAGTDSGSIRVATGKVDNIINLVGELLITQSMLCGFADGIDPSELDRLRQGLAQLARNTRELQECVMQIRMLPISFAFNRFPRIVHDLSRKLGKKVELKFTGEGTELDKTVLEKITDPLVHLVRNALDHGLETPERRAAAGKPETGTIELAAFHEGGNIIIEVRDDGAGLNKARILQKARERGLIDPTQELNDEQVDNLIFMPGFSTAEQVSDVSGRGVGMDVVRRNIHDLGGYVQITSREGEGSTIRIRLPLTLAILDGQLVRVGQETYIISLVAIVETIQIKPERLNTLVGRTEVFRLRDEVLPIVKLCDQFGIEPDSSRAQDGLLVVVEADGRRAGVLVDELLAQQQVVIKSLESNFKTVSGIAGATILGDGKVSLIIDVPELIRSAVGRGAGAVTARAA